MRTIDQLLAEHPFFEGLDQPTLALLTGCATNMHFAKDEYLFHEGEPAERFYVVRHGRVAIELFSPGAGPLLVESVDGGDVIGWSWLVPPYRWTYDARAVEATSAIGFDGVCLRGKCEEDSRLGYALMQRVASVMYDGLAAAQVRMLDLYGRPRAHAR